VEINERSVAIGFPGQGPHEPDKMRRLICEHPTTLDVFMEAEEVLSRPILPLMLKDRSPESTTRENQVRLYLGSSALWLAAEAEGFLQQDQKRIFFGASAGEYAALLAAGAYDFRTGLEQIDTRGEEMQKASVINPGKMLIASGLPFDEAKKIAANFKGVYAVNDNPGMQTVFSGSDIGVNEVAAYLASSEAWSHVRLDWPALAEAAHSIHMAPAVAGVKAAIKQAKIKKPSNDFISNQARKINSATGVKNHLPAQLTRGVLLRKSAQLMRDEYNVTTFIDVGPGKVLYGQMVRHFRKSVEVISIVDKLLPKNK
jgi:malonyl CoA-acyl carrier protein transacylase